MADNGMILLVEDNIKLNDANARILRMRGYNVITALTVAEARAELSRIKPEIILLDVMLPDGDGFDFCDEIRGKTDAHILFLTAKTEHADKVKGLTVGGDDYIMKPFHPEELLARVASVMRRREMEKSPVITAGNITLDIVSAQAFAHGKDLLLPQKEFALLLFFIQHKNEVLSAATLYKNVWGAAISNDKNTLQATISKLRKKIKNTDCEITVLRGQGYVFET